MFFLFVCTLANLLFFCWNRRTVAQVSPTVGTLISMCLTEDTILYQNLYPNWFATTWYSAKLASLYKTITVLI